MKIRESLAAIVFLLLFASCGTTSTPTSQSPRPTTLHVIRPVTLNNVPRYEQMIRDAVAVQHIYNAVNALPVQPVFNGAVNCPADLAIEYQLTFLRGTTIVQSVNVFPTGCRHVQIGQGNVHLHSLTDDFSSLLAKTIGLPSLVPKIGSSE